MASNYTLTAELPATRKSLDRSRNQTTQHNPLPTNTQNQLGAEDRLSVNPHSAWAKPAPTANNADTTIRRDLSLRRGGSRHAPKQPTLKSEFDSSSDPVYDDRGYLVLPGTLSPSVPDERFGLTSRPFSLNKENDLGQPNRSARLAYLEGVRGTLGLQVLIWTFFRLFAPAVVADRDIDGVYPASFLSVAPAWQTVLRKVLSPLLFDGELQAAFFVILSGRGSLQTFIERRVATGLAGPAFKRPFRFLIPVVVTLSLVTLVIGVNGFRYASEVSTTLQNQAALPPAQWTSALEFFNSIFFFFSTPTYYKTARATLFIPPGATLWIIPVLFQQTYVLIILAFTLPYTVLRYKNLGMILLILTTAWVGKWSWYTLTGLLFAEWSTIYLQLLPKKGIPINREGSRHCPTWVPGAVFLFWGTLLKYLWIAAFPEAAHREYIAHVDGNTGKLNYSLDPAQVAYPRYDNWLVATGVLYLIEISPATKRILSSKPLAYMGRWSFSITLITATLMLSLGSLLRHHLVQTLGWTGEGGILAVLFVVLIPASVVLAEVYSRIVDDAGLWVANWMFKWIRV
ncbi:uncharacterized protein UHOD_06810 [Ustilago sp. UG-2017b]|nr:uncharacterized protein UHOD_06810 [Ustilago sp. UG-2017b]